jgi:transposase
VELPQLPTRSLEVLVPHANAPLTELGRLRLARCVVDDGWPLRRAAERFQVSVTTAQRWAGRYRQQGVAGMVDRSSRPHRSPRQTLRQLMNHVIRLRRERGWGPARIGPALGMPASTVHKVLRRQGMPRLTEVDLATRSELRRQVRRYEHPAPGDLVHVDIKKLGNTPRRRWLAGGGSRPGRQEQAGHHAEASQLQAGDRLLLPAFGHRRPLQAGLHPRSCPMRPSTPRWRSGLAPWPGSPPAESRSSGS